VALAEQKSTSGDFRQRIRHPDLLRLYDYWLSRHRGDLLPSRQDLDPADFKFAVGNVTLIDVLHEPVRFRFRLIGSLMAQRMGWDLTGKLVDEVPDAEYREVLLTAYRQMLTSRQPSTTLYERLIDGKMRRFEVLRLPLAADGKTIDMLLLCPMYFEPLRARSPMAGPSRDSSAPKVVQDD
jgi:hypothetical protein